MRIKIGYKINKWGISNKNKREGKSSKKQREKTKRREVGTVEGRRLAG
jgi:hypothetical protein